MVGLVTAAVGCALAIKILLGLGVVDVPNFRSSHRCPTVRGAGMGVACGSVLGLLASRGVSNGVGWSGRALSVVIAASLSAALIGLVDDLRTGISFRVRLVGQAVVTFAAVALLGTAGVGMPWRVLLFGGSMVCVVGYINAFNFMDGINGISGVSAFVTGAMFAVLGTLERLPVLAGGGAALAAASFGFLPFNFPSARAFLGDVGSYFIGTWIALLAYIAALGGVPPDVVVAPALLYLADVGFTLVVRVGRGDLWHTAHQDHVYQRLATGGLGHTGTTTVVLAGTAILSGLGLVCLQVPGLRPVAWTAMVGLLVVYLASPSGLQWYRSR